MEMNDFINLFAEQFDNTASDVFEAKTEFHTLTEYTSLVALSIIAMVDEEYNVTLSGNEMKSARTIEDLYNIVYSKL